MPRQGYANNMPEPESDAEAVPARHDMSSEKDSSRRNGLYDSRNAESDAGSTVTIAASDGTLFHPSPAPPSTWTGVSTELSDKRPTKDLTGMLSGQETYSLLLASKTSMEQSQGSSLLQGSQESRSALPKNTTSRIKSPTPEYSFFGQNLNQTCNNSLPGSPHSAFPIDSALEIPPKGTTVNAPPRSPSSEARYPPESPSRQDPNDSPPSPYVDVHASQAASPSGEALNISYQESPPGEASNDLSAANPLGDVTNASQAASPSGEAHNESQEAKPSDKAINNSPPASPSTDTADNSPPASPSIEAADNSPPANPSAEAANNSPPANPSADAADNSSPASPSADAADNSPPASPSTDAADNSPPASPSAEAADNSPPASASAQAANNSPQAPVMPQTSPVFSTDSVLASTQGDENDTLSFQECAIGAQSEDLALTSGNTTWVTPSTTLSTSRPTLDVPKLVSCYGHTVYTLDLPSPQSPADEVESPINKQPAHRSFRYIPQQWPKFEAPRKRRIRRTKRTGQQTRKRTLKRKKSVMKFTPKISSSRMLMKWISKDFPLSILPTIPSWSVVLLHEVPSEGHASLKTSRLPTTTNRSLNKISTVSPKKTPSTASKKPGNGPYNVAKRTRTHKTNRTPPNKTNRPLSKKTKKTQSKIPTNDVVLAQEPVNKKSSKDVSVSKLSKLMGTAQPSSKASRHMVENESSTNMLLVHKSSKSVAQESSKTMSPNKSSRHVASEQSSCNNMTRAKSSRNMVSAKPSSSTTLNKLSKHKVSGQPSSNATLNKLSKHIVSSQPSSIVSLNKSSRNMVSQKPSIKSSKAQMSSHALSTAQTSSKSPCNTAQVSSNNGLSTKSSRNVASTQLLNKTSMTGIPSKNTLLGQLSSKSSRDMAQKSSKNALLNKSSKNIVRQQPSAKSSKVMVQRSSTHTIPAQPLTQSTDMLQKSSTIMKSSQSQFSSGVEEKSSTNTASVQPSAKSYRSADQRSASDTGSAQISAKSSKAMTPNESDSYFSRNTSSKDMVSEKSSAKSLNDTTQTSSTGTSAAQSATSFSDMGQNVSSNNISFIRYGGKKVRNRVSAHQYSRSPKTKQSKKSKKRNDTKVTDDKARTITSHMPAGNSTADNKNYLIQSVSKKKIAATSSLVVTIPHERSSSVSSCASTDNSAAAAHIRETSSPDGLPPPSPRPAPAAHTRAPDHVTRRQLTVARHRRRRRNMHLQQQQ